MKTLVFLVGLVGLFSLSLAMKEEYLDPDRDFHVSVGEDLRRVPRATVDENGRAVFERDYLRSNHRTSEYTKLQYRAVIEEDKFINLDKILSVTQIVCNKQYILVTSSMDQEWVEANLDLERYENQVLILGGPQWECECSNGLATAIFRVTTDLPRIIQPKPNPQAQQSGAQNKTGGGGTLIMIPCIETSPFDFIGSSQVEFFTNHTEVVANILEENEGEHQRRAWGNDHNGHFPVLDQTIDIINYNYDKNAKKAKEDPIMLYESALVDVRCENCYAYLGIGVGFEFQTDNFDLWRDGLICNDCIPWFDPPNRVEYLRLWISGDARAEVTFVAELNTNDPDGVEWNWLVNGGMKQMDRSDWQTGSFKPWEHGVKRLKRFFFMVGPVPVTIDLHLPVFMRTAIRTDKGKFWVGGKAYAYAESGLVFRGNHPCKMAGCHYIDQWRPQNSGWGPYRHFESGFDHWGPDFELPEQVEVDFALAPILTVHVWGSMIGFYVMFDNVLTLTFTFFYDSNDCARRALPNPQFPGVEVLDHDAAPKTSLQGSTASDSAGAPAPSTGRRELQQINLPTAMRVDFDYRLDAYFWAGINIVLGLKIKLGPVAGISVNIDIVFWEWSWTSQIFEWTDIFSVHLFDFCLSAVNLLNAAAGTGLTPIAGSTDCAVETIPLGFDSAFMMDLVARCSSIDVVLLPLANAAVGGTVATDRLLPQSSTSDFDYYAYSRVFQVTTQGFTLDGSISFGFFDIDLPDGNVRMRTVLDIPPGNAFSAALCQGELVLVHRDSTGSGPWQTTPYSALDCAAYPSVTFTTEAMLSDGTRQFVFARKDVHECNKNIDDCDDDATCINNFGSFTCECPTSWVDWSGGLGTSCDEDQCTAQTHDCDPAATCTDTEEAVGTHGGYDCACNAGWTDTATVGDDCAEDVPHPSGYWYDGLGLDTTDRECQNLGALEAHSMWKPCVDSECCAEGLVCVQQNEWYAQCLEPGYCEAMGYDQHPQPFTWSCKTLPLPEAEQPDVDGPCVGSTLWMPCTQSKCCADGLVCAEQSQWYAQCLAPGQCSDLGYDQLPAPHAWTCKEHGDTVVVVDDPPSCANPVGLWGGCIQQHCCDSGLVCYEQDAWYAQCLKPGQCTALGYDTAGWSCKELLPPSGGSQLVGAADRLAAEQAASKCPDNASLLPALYTAIAVGGALLVAVVALTVDRVRHPRAQPAGAQEVAQAAFQADIKAELTFPTTPASDSGLSEPVSPAPVHRPDTGLRRRSNIEFRGPETPDGAMAASLRQPVLPKASPVIVNMDA